MLVRIFAKVLRIFRVVDYDLNVRRVVAHPRDEDIQKNEMVIVKSGNIQKWACFKCPGGCGQTISLSLNPKRSPRWSVAVDWFGLPSVHPSVHQTNECGCHFWVKSGRIEWCPGGKPLCGNRER